jgi:CRP/FNR family transcriptional regulator, anaerobic regulatory protein
MFKEPVDQCQTCELGRNGSCPFTPRLLPRDAVVSTQGQVADEVGFVKSGILVLSSVGSTGDEQRVSVRGPRSVVGLEALEGQGAAEEVRALTDVVLCRSEVQRVKRWASAGPAANSLLQLAITEMGLRRAEVDLRQGPALARVARFAIQYAALVESGRGKHFSKERVARMLGMRPETFSRILRKLSDQGLIDSKQGIKVLNAAELERMGTTTT